MESFNVSNIWCALKFSASGFFFKTNRKVKVYACFVYRSVCMDDLVKTHVRWYKKWSEVEVLNGSIIMLLKKEYT